MFTKDYQTIKNEIQALIESYHYQDYEDEIHSSIYPLIMHYWNRMKVNFGLEVSELISFLRKCRGKPIELISTISHPLGRERKGQQLKQKLACDETILAFEKWVNTFLEEERGLIYSDHLGLKPRKTTEEKDPSNLFYTEPYSDDELVTITNLEKNLNLKKLHSEPAKKGFFAGAIYRNFNQVGIFKSKKAKTETGGNTGIVKEYAFIYDLIYIMEFEIKTNYRADKGKYDKVKGWMEAYKAAIDKKDS